MDHRTTSQEASPNGHQKAQSAAPRFSRSFVLSEIEGQMAHLERTFRFKEGDGWAVVDGKPQKVVMAFGSYDALRNLHEIFRGF